jgi:hypothetical protein
VFGHHPRPKGFLMVVELLFKAYFETRTWTCTRNRREKKFETRTLCTRMELDIVVHSIFALTLLTSNPPTP